MELSNGLSLIIDSTQKTLTQTISLQVEGLNSPYNSRYVLKFPKKNTENLSIDEKYG